MIYNSAVLCLLWSFAMLLGCPNVLAFQAPHRPAYSAIYSRLQSTSVTSSSPAMITSTALLMATTSDNSRRNVLTSLLIGTTGWLAHSASSAATDGATTPTKNPFDLVRFELYDPNGGVALMQKRIDDRDFEGLLEFTKSYDQVLRKQYMGKAKKLLPKDLQDKATVACNSVTFDLIGINRNSRKGQESYEGANKYLKELIQDAESLLALESSVVPAES